MPPNYDSDLNAQENGVSARRHGSAEGDPFDGFTHADVRLLIEEHPLAWVISPQSGAASLLPLVGEFDEKGHLTALIGHFARRNPLEQAFSKQARALILFNGPQSYVSSELAARTNWAPTWNYVQVSVEANIALEPERTEAALETLVETMERRAARPWQIRALGERYPGMLRQIVGFRANVEQVRGRFKLGQDEDLETLRSIVAGIGDPALARWMVRFNRERWAAE